MVAQISGLELELDASGESFLDRYKGKRFGDKVESRIREETKNSPNNYNPHIVSSNINGVISGVDVDNFSEEYVLPAMHDVNTGVSSNYVNQNGVIDLYDSIGSKRDIGNVNGLEADVQAPGFRQDSKMQGFANEMASAGITDKASIMKAGRAKGFTLIELLVVVSIIGVLAGILLPALGAGKEAARKAVCGANLKSIGTASQTYSTDYKGLTPVGVRDTDNSGNVIWSGGGIGYTLYGSMVSSHLNGDVKTFYCPSAGHQYKVDDVNNGAQNFGQPALNARSSYYQRGVPQGAQKNLNVTVTGDSRISNLNDLHIYNGAIFINHKNKINTLFSDSSISLLSVPDVWRNSFSSFGGPTVTGTWYQIDDNAIIVSP